MEDSSAKIILKMHANKLRAAVSYSPVALLDDFQNTVTSQFEDDVASENKFHEALEHIKSLLEKLCLPTADIEERLQNCKCMGQKLYCLQSAIIIACNIYIDALVFSLARTEGDKTGSTLSDTTISILSVQQKSQLEKILEYIVSIGIVRHFHFEISILSVKLERHPTCSRYDLFTCCKYLLSCCENSEDICNLILSKHLLSIIGALMQLCYSPTTHKYLNIEDHQFCLSMLSKVLTKWTQLQQVVKCLIILQGSSTRPAPQWLRKACGTLLSRCLLRRNGVAAVVTSLLTTFDNGMSNWKKAEVVSNILSTPSQSVSEKEKYYSIICSQILSLIQSEETKYYENDSEKVFLQVLVVTVFTLYKKNPDSTCRFFFNDLFHSLNVLYNIDHNNSGNHYAIAEHNSRITSCIESLNRIFLYFKHSDKVEVIKKLLVPHLHGMFSIFCWTKTTISHFQTILRHLLVTCLELYESETTGSLLLSLCGIKQIKQCDEFSSINSVKPDLDFSFDQNENITVSTGNTESPETVIENQNKKVDAILDLMSACNTSNLPTHVLIALIKFVGDLDNVEEDENTCLMTQEERAAKHLRRGESRLLAFALLTSLCETERPDRLLTDTSLVLTFVKAVLSKACKPPDGAAEHQTNVDSLKTCFAVVGVCLFNEMTRKEYRVMMKLIPFLQKISLLEHLDRNERETASDLAIAIATHGASSDIDLASFSETVQLHVKNLRKNPDEKESNRSSPPRTFDSSSSEKSCSEPTTRTFLASDDDAFANHRIDASQSLPMTSSNVPNDRVDPKDVGNLSKSELSKSLEEAISSVYDPSPPVRAAGLRFLSSCIKSGAAKDKANEFYDIFMEVLFKEEDTFVYLAVIQGIVEIIDKVPLTITSTSHLFDRLVLEYDTNIHNNTDESEIKAIKIGEVLHRLCWHLGDLAEYQSRKLIHVFFRGLRNNRFQVRSSCLSNLAELCPLLRHGLNSFQHELAECICNIAKTDSNVTVRRAAVHVIRSLVDSLGANMLQIFSDTIRRFYSVLKHCYEYDRDDVIQLHAQLALEALDDVMRDVIFNESDRKHRQPNKKITVLN